MSKLEGNWVSVVVSSGVRYIGKLVLGDHGGTDVTSQMLVEAVCKRQPLFLKPVYELIVMVGQQGGGLSKQAVSLPFEVCLDDGEAWVLPVSFTLINRLSPASQERYKGLIDQAETAAKQARAAASGIAIADQLPGAQFPRGRH